MRLLRSPLLFLSLAGAGCESTWKGADNDGDGVSAADGDCWDSSDGPVAGGPLGGEIHPGAPDAWYDGVDSNCEGDDDFDADGDGYAAMAGSTQPSDSLPDASRIGYGDCNDGDRDINPGAAEVCDGIDNNCDGVADEGVQALFYVDVDGDGFGEAGVVPVQACVAPAGYAGNNDDCDDGNGDINPGVAEVCDGIDNNCDGAADEGYEPSDYYVDADGDGYGDAAVAVTAACGAPTGYVADATDCDDADGDTNPGAAEACDGIDNNCDGVADEDLSLVTWYVDGDGDGWGLVSEPLLLCEGEDPPAGYARDLGDCDDGDGNINPGAPEGDCADPVDYNCDGSVGYADLDRDGFVACEECDDADGAVNPGATEVCDGDDNDCDGVVDPSIATDAATWYADADSDSYGNAAVTDVACEAPSGYVADATDCNDADGAVNPGATEVCDTVDNDCDGVVDPSTATDAATWYADADSDGYGNAAVTDVACAAPSGYVSNDDDCDDADGAMNPGATEVCDTVDNDCDGVVDGGLDCSSDTGDTGSPTPSVFAFADFGDGGACAIPPFARSDGGPPASVVYDDGAGECGAYVFGGGNPSGAPVTLAASFAGFTLGETYLAELEVVNLTASTVTVYADFGGGAVESVRLTGGTTETLSVSYVATGASATLRAWSNGPSNYDAAVTSLVITY